MPKEIKAWQCLYCQRYRKTRSAIVRHEEICFHNPDRKIIDGQMAIFATLPRELTLTDSYGVPDSDWEEPDWDPGKELSDKYKWWPRGEDGLLALGYIFKDGRWRETVGYIQPTFAPGYAWKDEFVPEQLEAV